MEKKSFYESSMQYVLVLQEVQERKKFEFVETVRILCRCLPSLSHSYSYRSYVDVVCNLVHTWVRVWMLYQCCDSHCESPCNPTVITLVELPIWLANIISSCSSNCKTIGEIINAAIIVSMVVFDLCFRDIVLMLLFFSVTFFITCAWQLIWLRPCDWPRHCLTCSCLYVM